MKKSRIHVIRLMLIGILLIADYALIGSYDLRFLRELDFFLYSLAPGSVRLIPFVTWSAFGLLAAALAISLVSIVASLADASGRGPGFLQQIARMGFFPYIVGGPIRRILNRLKLRGWIAVGGTIVFLLVVGLKAVDGLEDFDAAVAPFFRPQQTKRTDSPVRQMVIRTADNSVPKYRQHVLRTARDLLRSGARMVIIPMPSAMEFPEKREIIDSLQADQRILLFEARYWTLGPSFPPFAETEASLPTVIMTSAEFNSRGPIPEVFPWYPFTSQRFINPFPDPPGSRYRGTNHIDVALAAAGRYFGIPDSLPRVDGKSVVLGRIRIPVTEEGRAYSQFSWSFANTFLPFAAFANGDTLRYQIEDGTRMVESLSPSLGNEVAGKIVLVCWEYPNPQSLRNYGWRVWIPRRDHTFIIESAITGSIVCKAERIWIVFSLALIVISCYLMKGWRLSVAIGLTLLMGIGVVVSGIIALQHFHLLLDTGYPLVASLLSVIILPLVRLSHEAR